jgi:hypothetical protein
MEPEQLGTNMFHEFLIFHKDGQYTYVPAAKVSAVLQRSSLLASEFLLNRAQSTYYLQLLGILYHADNIATALAKFNDGSFSLFLKRQANSRRWRQQYRLMKGVAAYAGNHALH